METIMKIHSALQKNNRSFPKAPEHHQKPTILHQVGTIQFVISQIISHQLLLWIPIGGTMILDLIQLPPM